MRRMEAVDFVIPSILRLVINHVCMWRLGLCVGVELGIDGVRVKVGGAVWERCDRGHKSVSVRLRGDEVACMVIFETFRIHGGLKEASVVGKEGVGRRGHRSIQIWGSVLRVIPSCRYISSWLVYSRLCNASIMGACRLNPCRLVRLVKSVSAFV